jgi:hypothetical protein
MSNGCTININFLTADSFQAVNMNCQVFYEDISSPLVKCILIVNVPDSFHFLEKHDVDLHYFYFIKYPSNNTFIPEVKYKLEKCVRTISIKELCSNTHQSRYDGLVLFREGAYTYQYEIKQLLKATMQAIFNDARNMLAAKSFRQYLDFLNKIFYELCISDTFYKDFFEYVIS